MKNFKFNFKVNYTHWYSDKYNMVLIQNRDWNPNGDNGRGDAIGRTFMAYYTYKDERFLNGIKKCWEKKYYEYSNNFLIKLFQKIIRSNKKYYYQGYRHPNKNLKGLSRDHVINTILAYKESNMNKHELQNFVKHLRFKISNFALFTPNMWLWARAVSDLKWAEYLYYITNIPTMYIQYKWNRYIYNKVPFDKEQHQSLFIKIPNNKKPKREKYWSKKLYPVYVMYKQAWQLHYLKKSKLKTISQNLLLKMCPIHNYVIRLLCEDIPKENFLNYKSMVGGRWTTILQSYINDRDLYVNENEKQLEYNVLDEDFLKKIYYNKTPL